MAEIENIHCPICTQPIPSSWQNALPPALAIDERRGVLLANHPNTWPWHLKDLLIIEQGPHSAIFPEVNIGVQWHKEVNPSHLKRLDMPDYFSLVKSCIHLMRIIRHTFTSLWDREVGKAWATIVSIALILCLQRELATSCLQKIWWRMVRN